MRPADINLGIGGGTNSAMTGRMMCALDECFSEVQPDLVLVYGDTNSTAAAAFTAKQHRLPLAHVEAGLRSGDLEMPEEINRVVTDRLSDRHYCPSSLSVQKLENEGIRGDGVKVTGDVMFDLARRSAQHSAKPAALGRDDFLLATIHRPANVDDRDTVVELVRAMEGIHRRVAPVVAPLHPRTIARLQQWSIEPAFDVIEPVGYLEMTYLIQNSLGVITDSGGLQKEAFFHKRPCTTVRNSTEWIELVEIGVNRLTSANALEASVIEMLETPCPDERFDQLVYGNGNAGDAIASDIASTLRL